MNYIQTQLKQAVREELKCPYCGSEAKLVNGNYVYGSKWGHIKMWVCKRYPMCDSYTSVHRGTDVPMGTLADTNLRNIRKQTHKLFDELWKSGYMDRKRAYRKLAHELHIDYSQAHIGMFDEKMCQRTQEMVKKINNSRNIAQHSH